MNLLSLQQQFGTEPAYIYVYSGDIPTTNVNAYITEKFAQAAGTNLISCIVTYMQSVYLVYTQNDYGISSSDFSLLCTLPIIIETPVETFDVPIVETPTETPNETPTENPTVEQEIQGNI
jgi:hypothetical protein